jgi:cysteine desulfurase
MLAQAGIYTNTGSACASKALKTSPVLGAIGIRADLAQGSAVFSINGETTESEIDYVLEKLPSIVDRLRSFSPIWGKEIPEYEEDVCH